MNQLYIPSRCRAWIQVIEMNEREKISEKSSKFLLRCNKTMNYWRKALNFSNSIVKIPQRGFVGNFRLGTFETPESIIASWQRNKSGTVDNHFNGVQNPLGWLKMNGEHINRLHRHTFAEEMPKKCQSISYHYNGLFDFHDMEFNSFNFVVLKFPKKYSRLCIRCGRSVIVVPWHCR